MSSEKLTIEQRVNISVALKEYLRAKEVFESASERFNAACQKVRTETPVGSRVLVEVNHSYFILTVDKENNFDVDQIEKV